MRKSGGFFLLLFILSSQLAQADIVRLNNGRKVTGTVLEDTPQFVRLQWGDGSVKWAREDVS